MAKPYRAKRFCGKINYPEYLYGLAPSTARSEERGLNYPELM